ncbi:RNA-directed DNA polymerase [Ideonella azotifigens]|uniref:antiviral reverse transcriptase Drt3b n=1 Tax=Ideonella azotifigens TaxID=513160 RepID=UPI001B877F1D|nr:antiviral reverse transcriptase Drt3b [Ideonella azotifigens]MCD2344854.1 RNA-directed DNA polymerase [Ideonella azotifigens]
MLTDMLPFEVPPTFSNRGYFRFLRNHSVEIEKGQLRWICETTDLDLTLRILFGIAPNTPIATETVTEWGKHKTRRSVPISKCRMDTVPFNFRVAHNLDGRTLSIVHPRNQVDVANFYVTHSALITYYTSVSDFSIRRPVSVSRYVYYKDKLHEERLDSTAGVEEEGREYEQLGSYFVYKKYRNIHRFFESHQYHSSEKKYDAMVQIDVNKCFDSIYTHSLPWSVLGRDQTKFSLEESKATFGGRFDALMQNLNHKETNGIVIGPEFSRIFAEIILQSVDAELCKKLFEGENLTHRVDYEIFRYVDDFFVFYNKESTRIKIFETLQGILKSKKLSINTAKIKQYQKPIITEITIAKERISTLLKDEIDPVCEEEEPTPDSLTAPKRNLVCSINTNRLITRYKSVIKGAGVTYGDLLNYTFGIIENKLEKLCRAYVECDKSDRDRKRLIKAMLASMEYVFFCYSASPKVNHTIRLCRMVATSVGFLHAQGLPYELKHLLFKYIQENVMQQLEKNTMSNQSEVESLYLLISLSYIGREYWLPVSVILRHFLITEEAGTGNYVRPGFMSHFSITVLLSYIKDKVRYVRLKTFLEAHIIAKLEHMEAYRNSDTEALILLLDLVICPYISFATKTRIGQIFDLDAVGLSSIQSSNDHWFTAWGDRFDLGKELDAKRSREVY